jgi:hypothetical protein
MYILLRRDREISEKDILKVYFVVKMRKNAYLPSKG